MTAEIVFAIAMTALTFFGWKELLFNMIGRRATQLPDWILIVCGVGFVSCTLTLAALWIKVLGVE